MPMATTVTQRADPELRRTAERHLEAGEWKQAIRCYNRMVDRDPECELKRNLARNLAALEEHQPAAYAGLMATPPSANYEIRQTRHGLTVAHIGEHGKATLLSPGSDPARGVREALADLEPRFEQGEAIGLASIGDGYLLAELAARDDRTPMGARTGIHLFEPDPALLLMVMHLHDYSGPRGPE